MPPAMPAAQTGAISTPPATPAAPIEPTVPAVEQPVAGAYMPQQAKVVDASPEYYKERADQRAHKMRAILAAQPKILTMVPLMPGEKKGTMLPVGINGYFVQIMKGVFVPVPEQVAKMVAKSLNLTYSLGEADQADSTEAKKQALA
jgi:hypothetical protein